MRRTFGEMYFDRISGGLTPDEIRSRYAAMLTEERESGDTADGTPEERARVNLGYILGYFDKATREAWYAALTEVSHPIFGESFGRGGDPSPEEAFRMGQELGKQAQ